MKCRAGGVRSGAFVPKTAITPLGIEMKKRMRILPKRVSNREGKQETVSRSLLFLFVLLIAGAAPAAAQNAAISGVVVDAQTGETLPGVNVVIQGTQQGAATNPQGQYTISNLEAGTYSLVATFIGYSEALIEDVEVSAGETAIVDIAMEPAALDLDEVVVTALGEQRQRRSIGYATETISGESLAEIPTTNFASLLKGKAAGVSLTESPTPGGSVGIIIRGANSLSGNNQPLIIVDGIPIDNQNLGEAQLFGGIDYGDGIGNINPNDIESVTILKGPNAAAIYGAQAANGAVVITTKSGAAGRRGVGVEYTSSLTFQELSTFPTFQNTWAGGYDDDWSAWGTTEVNGEEVPMWPSWLLDHWGPRMDGTEIAIQSMPGLGTVPLTPQPEDNIRNFFDTGTTFQNSLAFSGGNESTNYRFSVSDMRDQGMVPGSQLGRNTVNLRVVSDITDRLTLDGKANYVHQEGEDRSGLGASFRNPFQNLILLARFVDLDWLKDYQDDEGRMVNYKNNYPINPYWVVNEFQNEDTRNRFIGFLSGTYDLTDWLSLQLRTSADVYNDKRFRRVAPGTPGTLTGEVVNQMFDVQQYNSDFLLSADNQLTEDLTGGIQLGGRYLYEETEMTGNHGENLLLSDLYHISNAGLVTPQSSLRRKAVSSLYGVGRLDYKNYLFLNLTGRNDWSSTLGENNNSFFYPSVSLAWVFNEALGIESNVFSYGKLRAAYAQTGTDANPYLTNLGYFLSSSSFAGQNMASIQSTIPLTDLKNELTTSWEVGADLRFLNNRIGLDATYYREATENQILPVDISSATGFSQRIINAGEIRNEGVELSLDSTPILTRDFAWDLDVNFSKNKSTVVSLADGVDSYILISAFGANIEARPGEAFGNLIGYEYKRNEEGRKIVSVQGSPQRAEQQTILGNIQPDWLGSVGNTLRYKGISVSALLDIRQGGEVFSYSKYDQMAKGTGKFTEDRDNLIVDGVVENEDGTFSENDKEVVSHMYYAMRAWGNIGEEFIVDASYIALRQASLGYTFPSRLLSRLPITGLDLALVARNLFYLQRAEDFEVMGIAPESAFNRSAPAQGYEARNFPLPRTLGFRVNMRF